MKGSFAVAAVAALSGVVNAHSNLRHRHVHPLKRDQDMGDEGSMCIPGCTTIWSTIYGQETLHHPPPPTTSVQQVMPESIITVVVVPTPLPVTCPTPGTYTFPAKTVTLTETTTVCAATSTTLPSGTHTIGGVTTVVEVATTVVCPIAAVTTESGVVTSTVELTTYVCPTPGTYTIGAVTTTVTVDLTVVVYPVVTTYCPGTYTAPAVVTTVTETDYVFFCPFTGGDWSTSTAAPAATSPPPPPPPPAQEEVVTGPGSTITNHWATTYTPYNNDGTCKSADQVTADIEVVSSSNFKAVRIYSTDCNALQTVGGACEQFGLKIIIGVFVKGDGCSYDAPTIKEQVDAIAAWAKWDMVELFVVGNEAIFDGLCSASQLAGLISDTRTRTGYSGPITCTEPTNIWQEPASAAALCPVIDYVGGNIHAYFNPQTTPSEAGTFVLGQLSILDQICPGKTSVNLESGWPKEGNCNGVACPGVDNQAIALKALVAHCGHRTTFFSYSDDLWKSPGACGCETSWGCGNLFTNPAFYTGL